MPEISREAIFVKRKVIGRAPVRAKIKENIMNNTFGRTRGSGFFGEM